MSTIDLKSGINEMIDKIEDEKLLQVVFNLLKEFEHDESDSNLLTEQQWTIVNERIERYNRSEGKSISYEELKKNIDSSRNL